jgi:hypothetical protein
MESAPLTPENPASYYAVLIATGHTRIDYRFLAAHARLGGEPQRLTREAS